MELNKEIVYVVVIPFTGKKPAKELSARIKAVFGYASWIEEREDGCFKYVK